MIWGQSLQDFDKLPNPEQQDNQRAPQIRSKRVYSGFSLLRPLSSRIGKCIMQWETLAPPYGNFSAKLKELNNYPPLFPVLDNSNKMKDKDLDEVLNGCDTQAYLQGWEFKVKTYSETYEMFKWMKISEQFYKGGGPSFKNREDSNRSGHIKKHKGMKSVSSTNPKKGCVGKHNKSYSVHPSDGLTSDKIWLFHGPWHFTEECKLLQGFYGNYAS